MTQDNIEDFTATLRAERRGYLLCIHNNPMGVPIVGLPSVHVTWNLDDWPSTSSVRAPVTREYDTAQAIVAALREDSEPMIVLNAERINSVLGALDSLATALADHKHVWSEGERVIYEEAVSVLKINST